MSLLMEPLKYTKYHNKLIFKLKRIFDTFVEYVIGLVITLWFVFFKLLLNLKFEEIPNTPTYHEEVRLVIVIFYLNDKRIFLI